jgi:hypothetical protein
MINIPLAFMQIGLVTVEWPKSIEGKYLRVTQKEK